MAIKILGFDYLDPGSTIVLDHSANNTDAIAVGDLISLEAVSGTQEAVCMDAETEDTTFAGVALTAAEASKDQPVTVMVRGLIRASIAGGTAIAPLDGLKYSDGDSGTAYELDDDGGSNTIAWAWENVSDTATEAKVFIDVFHLGKLPENNS